MVASSIPLAKQVGSSGVDWTVGGPINQQQPEAASTTTYHITDKSNCQAA